MEKCRKCKMRKINYQDMSISCKKNMEQACQAEDGECEWFKSRYIEYPLTIQGIDNRFGEKWHSFLPCGNLVGIRPCADQYGDKTYLGILLGELPVNAIVTFRDDDQKLHITPETNPAIFVPELKTIIYGYESFWWDIESPDELKQITNEDIDNVWYVQLMRGMLGKEDNKSHGE